MAGKWGERALKKDCAGACLSLGFFRAEPETRILAQRLFRQ